MNDAPELESQRIQDPEAGFGLDEAPGSRETDEELLRQLAKLIINAYVEWKQPSPTSESPNSDRSPKETP